MGFESTQLLQLYANICWSKKEMIAVFPPYQIQWSYQCGHSDMKAKEGCFHGRWNNNNGERATTWIVNKTICRKNLYRNNAAVWPSMAKCCESTNPQMCMEHHKILYSHYSKCSNWCLLCCTHMWIQCQHHWSNGYCPEVHECFKASHCEPWISSGGMQ